MKQKEKKMFEKPDTKDKEIEQLKERIKEMESVVGEMLARIRFRTKTTITSTTTTTTTAKTTSTS